ncbi:MAG: DUF177 domain-containing protein [Bacteroidales bacterium]|nr:DUF177 domain-containing protein [Bacteroidales bacterium]
MYSEFAVPITRLKQGHNLFEWHVGNEFFGSFENSEVLGADVDVKVDVMFDGCDVKVAGEISGNVTVVCDRCLENVSIPVSTAFEDDGFEDCNVIDLEQDIYDFTCTALPMKRVHPDGECDERTVSFMSK